MDEDTSNQEKAKATERAADPWEGVPPGCGTPRSWTPFWLALAGFFVWLGCLVALLIIRFHTSAA
ncbi:MAG: hypothetical protein JXQ73_13810 [Phycisphaerae bacterium]|nr:hypothetical protein [Phycisphaerae bacterium]